MAAGAVGFASAESAVAVSALTAYPDVIRAEVVRRFYSIPNVCHSYLLRCLVLMPHALWWYDAIKLPPPFVAPPPLPAVDALCDACAGRDDSRALHASSAWRLPPELARVMLSYLCPRACDRRPPPPGPKRLPRTSRVAFQRVVPLRRIVGVRYRPPDAPFGRASADAREFVIACAYRATTDADDDAPIDADADAHAADADPHSNRCASHDATAATAATPAPASATACDAAPGAASDAKATAKGEDRVVEITVLVPNEDSRRAWTHAILTAVAAANALKRPGARPATAVGDSCAAAALLPSLSPPSPAPSPPPPPPPSSSSP